MWDQLRAKGREILITLTAAGILLSIALPMVGDMLLILVTGAMGWFLSEGKPKE